MLLIQFKKDALMYFIIIILKSKFMQNKETNMFILANNCSQNSIVLLKVLLQKLSISPPVLVECGLERF